MRLWVAIMRCPASLRLSIASSRTVSSSAMTEVYGRASCGHPIVSPSCASSPTSAERSRAVSLATSFGYCGPLYGSLILCLKTIEQTLAILLLVLVYPHDQRGLVRLHRHVSDGRYVQYFGAGVTAHGLQFLENFSWDSDRLLLAHPPRADCSDIGPQRPRVQGYLRVSSERLFYAVMRGGSTSLQSAVGAGRRTARRVARCAKAAPLCDGGGARRHCRPRRQSNAKSHAGIVPLWRQFSKGIAGV